MSSPTSVVVEDSVDTSVRFALTFLRVMIAILTSASLIVESILALDTQLVSPCAGLDVLYSDTLILTIPNMIAGWSMLITALVQLVARHDSYGPHPILWNVVYGTVVVALFAYRFVLVQYLERCGVVPETFIALSVTTLFMAWVFRLVERTVHTVPCKAPLSSWHRRVPRTVLLLLIVLLQLAAVLLATHSWRDDLNNRIFVSLHMSLMLLLIGCVGAPLSLACIHVAQDVACDSKGSVRVLERIAYVALVLLSAANTLSVFLPTDDVNRPNTYSTMLIVVSIVVALLLVAIMSRYISRYLRRETRPTRAYTDEYQWDIYGVQYTPKSRREVPPLLFGSNK